MLLLIIRLAYFIAFVCNGDDRTVRARQVSEVISGTLASVAKYPIGKVIST